MTVNAPSRELNLSPELDAIARQADLRIAVNRLALELRPHGAALVELALAAAIVMRQNASREGTAPELVMVLAAALGVERKTVDAMADEIFNGKRL